MCPVVAVHAPASPHPSPKSKAPNTQLSSATHSRSSSACSPSFNAKGPPETAVGASETETLLAQVLALPNGLETFEKVIEREYADISAQTLADIDDIAAKLSDLEMNKSGADPKAS